MPELLPSPEVRPEEPIARHCRHGSSMRKGEGRAHFSVFLPDAERELSVVRSEGISEDDLRSIGALHVGQDLKGHATVSASVILDRGLNIHPDGDPHPRHANVLNWDEDDSRNRLHAKAIANATTLTPY